MVLNTSEVESVIREVLPMESELCGDGHLQHCAELAASGRSVPTEYTSEASGHKMEPIAALLAVAAVANLVKTCVDVYLSIEKRRATKPTKDEYNAELAKNTAALTETVIKAAAAVFTLLTGKR